MKTQDVSASQPPTGSVTPELTQTTRGLKRILRKIGPYVITVILTQDDKFVEVEMVSVDKNFLDLQQRLALAGVHDVEKYFEEEEEHDNK